MRKRYPICSALAATALLAFAAVAARADLVIKITQGVSQPTPIAVVPFAWGGQGQAPVDAARVIGDDLARSGLFAPLPVAKMLAQPSDGSNINFTNWKAVNVNYLVVGAVTPSSAGVNLRFQLFNVYTQQQLLGYLIPSPADSLRFTAHVASDMIYQKLTGKRGAFATQIAYVKNEGTQQGKTTWELVVADADGANSHVIDKSPDVIMSPSWSPDGQRIAYVQFENHETHIYVQDIRTGVRKMVLSHPGVNGAPAFSPDGKRLAVVLSTHPGNLDVYVLDLATGKLQQVTSDPAIDTEPAWLPDGRAIIFTSDRGGSPQLYEKQLGSSSPPQRLTWDGSYNARASVSPDGKSVALVHRDNGALRIALLDLASGNLTMLTNGPSDLSPSFAPNGAMILYSTVDAGQRVLATVSVDSQVRSELSGTTGALSQPAWGPFPQRPGGTPSGSAGDAGGLLR